MKETIKKIIMENRPDIENLETAQLVKDGILDSFDIVTLVAEFDKAFGISIDGVKISPKYFNTVDDIVRLIEESKK